MGHHTEGHGARAISALLATLVLSLALASQALAGPPVHLRAPKLDVTGLNHACGTAVDNKGDLYASSAGEGKIKVYGPTDHKTPIAEISNPNEPCALAVESFGALLVSEQATGSVVLYAPDAYPLSGSPTYSAAKTIDASGEAKGIAVDPVDNRLYVAEGDRVAAYASETQNISIQNASGGTYKLRFEGEETASLPAYASVAEVKAALEDLASIAAGAIGVSNTGFPGQRQITFGGALAYRDVPQIEVISSLTGNSLQRVTVKAAGGTFTLTFQGQQTTAIKFDASAAELKAALEGLANIAPGDVAVTGGPGGVEGQNPYFVRFEGAYANTGLNAMAGNASGLGGGMVGVGNATQAQKVTVEATGGTFALTFQGQQTAAIKFDAAAAEVKAALEALSSIAPGDVTVTGGPGDAEGSRPYLVRFEGAYAGVEAQVEMLKQLTGNGTVDRISNGPTAGVSTPVPGGFDAGAGYLLEGMIGEATGVAAYTYLYPVGNSGSTVRARARYLTVADAASDELKFFWAPDGASSFALLRTISGVDQDHDPATPEQQFGFGAKGAYLTADRGNENASTLSCVTVAGQACTKGHVYLYDAAHAALDELDAAGEFLEQTRSPGFAAAEATQVAVDRSGGARDGTLYVSAGNDVGAKLLALAPLAQPSRAQLGAPLSKVLKGARAVTVDCRGYVYVAAETRVRVYDPKGDEVTSFEDKNQPSSLAADCSGHVYVFDKQEMTYYTPSAYPPEAATAYVRHAALVSGSLLSGAGMSGVAVDPTDGHVLFPVIDESSNNYSIVELASASEGSAAVGECDVGSSGVPGTPLAVDLYAKTGELYVATSLSGGYLSVLRCEEGSKKATLVRRIRGGSCPSGLWGASPKIAVDQANGHVVQFQYSSAGSSAAREYDSSGACVAQFGTFSSANVGSYGIAVDSSCALHKPPLTGVACEGFDPANGNVYVAFDGPNNTTQPNDVTAFGPLGYPAVGKRELTVEKAGKGGGKVSSSPAAIDCGLTCSAEFGAAETVTLTAKAEAGSEFESWEGCEAEKALSATEGLCEAVVPEDRKVSARFEPKAGGAEYPLTVVREGLGSGEVKSTPDGIECPSTCNASFVEGFKVLLKAKAASGSEVAKWTGCEAQPSAGECEVTMTGAKEVKASFDVEHPLLTVSPKGSGSGEVTSAPAGIACPSACAAKFNLNQAVTLTAKATPGSKFTGWSGCDSEPTPSECKVTLSGGPRTIVPTFEALPQVKARTALPVGYDEATLRGEVDPKGLATTYRFQYLTEAEYEAAGNGFKGAQETPAGKLEAAKGLVAVQAPVLGLAEGSAYRFRLIAASAVGEAIAEGPAFETLVRAGAQDCSNAEYRTGLASFLPDCRAYELVTPPQTFTVPGVFGSSNSLSDGGVFNSYFVAPRGPSSGDSLAYGAGVSHVDGSIFRGQRAAGTHPAAGWGAEMYGFDYAQSTGESQHRGVSADQRYMLQNFFVGNFETGRLFPVGRYLRVPAGHAGRVCAPQPKGPFEESDPKAEFELVGCGTLGVDLNAQGRFVTVAGTHVIFSSKVRLEPAAPAAGAEAIYDREAGSSEAELISLLPDGKPVAAAENLRYVAATEDGASVVFQAGANLYVRRGGQTRGVAKAPNTYAGVSEDGKRVFFIDKALASFSPVPAAGLYACDLEAGPCAGAGAHAPAQIAKEAFFVNVSADGSHAFFTAKAALTGGEENDLGQKALAGKDNLYAWEEGALRFVAILDPVDLERFKWSSGGVDESLNLRQWARAIAGQDSVENTIGRAYSPTRSTPDGNVLVFQSHARLSGYDNEGHGEIYRYDPGAPAGRRLLCVSCNPSAAPHAAVVDALLRPPQGGVVSPIALIPNLTDDGQRVIFESDDRLLPGDANELTDVYEWKAPGFVGPGGDACIRSGGCLALISTGQTEDPSRLFGMSADGRDVFFVTREILAGSDVTGSWSIYDAREGGGIPERPTPAPCQGDACQGQGSPPPVLPSPATGGGGGGNVEEPVSRKPCGKGKRRVKDRCVKVKRHRKHRKRAHRRRAGHIQRAGR